MAANILFWFFAIAAVGGAIFTITRRNPVAAVVGLVGVFVALAALYAMLSAHFLAVIQVLVYAGAIMVLFTFVVMVLNREETRPFTIVWPRNIALKLVAGAAVTYLFAFRLVDLLVRATSGQALPARGGTPPETFGTLRAVGRALYTDYLFPFEAVSVLLLVAVIGALVVGRGGRSPSSIPTPTRRVGE